MIVKLASEDLKILNPITNDYIEYGKNINVPLTAYFARRLRDGDLIDAEAGAIAKAVAEAEAIAEAQAKAVAEASNTIGLDNFLKKRKKGR